jgi:cytochrome c oxidase subunit II
MSAGLRTARAVACALGALFACGGVGTERGAGAPDGAAEAPIEIQASRWAYAPAVITLHKGVPAVLHLSSSDVHHGFNVPGLGLRADILPGQVTTVHVTPRRTGTFLFHCDYYCGSGHEGMDGQIIVR